MVASLKETNQLLDDKYIATALSLEDMLMQSYWD